MKKLALLFLNSIFLICTSSTIQASDLVILTGHQFNSNFTIGPPEQWPPVPEPYPPSGSSIELQEGQSFSLGLDFTFDRNPDQQIGLFFTTQNSELGGVTALINNSIQVSHLHFTGTNFYPQENSKLTGFVTAGLGGAYYETNDPTLKNVFRFSAQIGAGFNYQISNSIAYQMDARWIPTFFSSNTAIFCNGGCTISISSRTFDQVQINAGLRFTF